MVIGLPALGFTELGEGNVSKECPRRRQGREFLGLSVKLFKQTLVRKWKKPV